MVVKKGPKPPKTPRHFSAEMRSWWATVVGSWVLEPHHLHVLRLACEAFDRGQDARKVLQRDGLTIRDKYGTVKPHPAAAIVRDAAAQFERLLRALDLDTEPPSSLALPRLSRTVR